MRQRLQALGQVHRIAMDAVAHPAIAAEAARDHRAGGDAHADLHLRRRRRLSAPPVLPYPGRHGRHGAGRLAGMKGVIGVLQRRVPEGGKAIGGQPVDGAAMGQGLIDQRRQRFSIRRVKPAGSSL